MCGIVGFAALGPRAPIAPPEVLHAMAEAIVHRGPDGEGLLHEGPVALGMRRLAIVDVAGGQQPIWNERRSVAVVFNGEIYNYPALRERLLARGHTLATHSDTEALVHLYEDHGLELMQHLDGMFAFALYDFEAQRLLIARDRMGEKPLHYTQADGQLLFASELKSLLRHPAFQARLEPRALSRFLQHEYVPSPMSIFQGVHKLPPAHFLVLEGGELSVKPYWRLDLTPRPKPPKPHEAAAELRERLGVAVRKQLMADVPLGVFLSGGLDSSTVAALATQAGSRLKTFAIGFEDASFDESDHAATVAKHLGCEHHLEVLSPSKLVDLVPQLMPRLDEPFADPSVLPTHLLAAFARKHVTVALGGDGGDELLGGYPTYQAAKMASWYDAAPAPLRAAVLMGGRAVAFGLPTRHDNLTLDYKLRRFTMALDQPPLERHVQWLGALNPGEQAVVCSLDLVGDLMLDEAYDHLRGLWAQSEGLDPVARALHLDATSYLPDDILVKVDRATMATSLEARAPFLDHHLVEWIAGLPSSYKLRGFTTKWLLREAAKPLLPDGILARPKKGFGIPVAKWLRGELKASMLDWLAGDRLKAQGLFDEAAVHQLIREHLDGKLDHRKALWALMVFQMWHHTWLEGRSGNPHAAVGAPA